MLPKSWPIEFEQILGQAAALQHRAHEGEERDREQQVVRDDREQLEGQVAHVVMGDDPHLDGDEAEEQADGREREGGGIADQQKDDQPPEHHGAEIGADRVDHCSGFS